jgi:very-short-patch-repair endonuclease
MTRIPSLKWQPGDVRAAVLEAERLIREAGFHCPAPAQRFYERLADEAESVLEADAEEWLPGQGGIEAWEQARADAAWRLNLKFDGITGDLFLVTEMGESPIEAMFGAWVVLFGSDGYNDVRFHFGPESRFDPEWGTNFVPQVDIAKYRADFLFKVCLKGSFRMLAVECDGHDYHERTAAQAERDRSRDRRLLMNGVHVLRFTGREIVRDVAACVDDLSMALSRLAEELLVDAGIAKRRPEHWIRQNVSLDGPPPRPKRH